METPSHLTAFIRLPYTLYRNCPHWVPPLEMERRKFLDPGRNPFFEHAEAAHFLLLDGNKNPAGRISAVIDRNHNDYHQERTAFFGLFECIEDPGAAAALLDRVQEWARGRGMECLRGPMNLSTNHECGLLVEGFDRDPVLGMPYNPPYYASLLETWGLAKCKDLLSFKVDTIEKVPDYMREATEKILKRGRFEWRPFRPGRFREELNKVWEIYNEAWSRNWGFVPMTHKEFLFAAGEMKPILIPELCMIAEVKGEPAGFSLSLPDFNQTLKKMKGRLFPFGLFHFLTGRKRASIVRTLTLGVKPKFRRLGMEVVFIDRTYQWALDHGVKLCDQSWILEDNNAMIQPILRVGGTIYKRHRIYERPLAS